MKKLLLAVLALSLPAFGQAASSFTVGAQIVGLSGQPAQVATDAGGRIAVTDKLELGTDNYIGADYHSHFGTVSYQLPLKKYLAKTNLTESNYRFGVKGGLGLVFPNQGNQHISGLAGGFFQYSPAGNGKFALEGGADWISAAKQSVAVHFGPVLTF